MFNTEWRTCDMIIKLNDIQQWRGINIAPSSNKDGCQITLSERKEKKIKWKKSQNTEYYSIYIMWKINHKKDERN